jgi:hypothetical protein
MLNSRIGRVCTNVPVCGVLLGIVLSSVPASAQFRPNANNGPVLYRDPNFNGPNMTVRGDVADLRPSGLNDQVSSIRIPPGETWEVCQDVNYGNGCQTLTSSVADLAAIGWDDRISSVRRIDGFQNGGYQDRGVYPNGQFPNSQYPNGQYPNGQYPNSQYPNSQYPAGQYPNGDFSGSSQQAQDEIVLYDRPGYRGAAAVVTRDAYDEGARVNRRAGSVAVRGGTWELCDRTGRCASVSQGVSNLSQLGLNGQITSVRPVANQQGGYFGNFRQ